MRRQKNGPSQILESKELSPHPKVQRCLQNLPLELKLYRKKHLLLALRPPAFQCIANIRLTPILKKRRHQRFHINQKILLHFAICNRIYRCDQCQSLGQAVLIMSQIPNVLFRRLEVRSTPANSNGRQPRHPQKSRQPLRSWAQNLWRKTMKTDHP